MTTPRRTLSTLLLFVALSTIFLDYWEYSRTFHADPGIWSSILDGSASAPAQYRIGVLKAAELLTHHSPLAMRHALALIDLAALLIAAFVLRSLLTRSEAWRSASGTSQWFGAASFIVLLEYSLAWLTWYQRPETLTIAALLALSLWLSTYRLPVAGAARSFLTALALVAVGTLLGFIRADAAITFNLGIAFVCLLRPAKTFALPRRAQLSASLAAGAAAGAVQIYLMRIVYPHTTYGSTPVSQLMLNVSDHIRIVPFALFVAPTMWLAVEIVRRHFAPSAAQMGLLIASAMFLCLWCVLGKIDEVRIFLPFAFALAPVTVETAMARIGHVPARADVS